MTQPLSSDYTITAVDYTTLPTALLALTKQHLRVDFPDDDTIITRYIAAAISYFEMVSDWRVFAATVSWFPVLSTTAYAYQCPVQPVGSFTVMAGGAPQTDVSAEYMLVQTSPILPAWLQKIDKQPFHLDATITLVGGFADFEKLPPNVLNLILRITGTLYENRESVAAPPLQQVPFWLPDLLVGTWIPRA
jgi:uncharacterized phiE125 gp8 family phage protein